MFIAAVFTIVKRWNQPTCPSMEERIKMMFYTQRHMGVHTHTVKLCRPKNEGNLPICEKWMDLDSILLNEIKHFSSIQLLSCVRLFMTPGTAAHQASLSITNSQSLLKFTSIELVMPSNHLILCRPLLLLPSIFPSIRVFSSKSVLHIWWPKNWTCGFSISTSSEYSGLISFRIDWLNLPAVQGTLKSLLQHHSSKAAIPQCSGFFIVQLSHPYVTTGKTVSLTRRTFVRNVSVF